MSPQQPRGTHDSLQKNRSYPYELELEASDRVLLVRYPSGKFLRTAFNDKRQRRFSGRLRQTSVQVVRIPHVQSGRETEMRRLNHG